MKKLSTILISAALTLAAGHAAAQTVAHAAVQSTMQGMAQAAGQVVAAATSAATAPTPATVPAPAPRPAVVKDFAAARSFELERTKFHLGAIEKFRKCVEVAKVAPDLAACQTAYRTALTGNLNTLVKQGKMAAAYETAPTPKPADVAPVSAPASAK